jgi:ribonucleoside-diphosphate reductase alpha chain
MESITRGWKIDARISMNSGGIGEDFSQLRHSEIGQSGSSRGIVPWMKITNEVLKTVDQAGKRKGVGTSYLRDWHIDISEFVELRDEGPEDMRTRDLFLAIWMSDLFMKRVKADGVWSLFCPNKVVGLCDVWGVDFEREYERYEREGKFSRQIRARELWDHILTMQLKTGMPFILYGDACNRKSNQRHSGVIRCSNLCVAGDTMILTDQGHFEIETLVGQNVNIWNGEEWCDVLIKKTGTNKDLLRVNLSNGVYLDCTPEHKFYIQKNYQSKKPVEIMAKDLMPKMKLIKFNFPIVTPENPDTFNYPYTHGFYCGDGTNQYNEKSMSRKICLYGEKKYLLSHLDYISHGADLGDKINVSIPSDMAEKFIVPLNCDIETKLLWLAGYCDADGTVARNGTNESIQIASINKPFLLNVRLMLNSMGIDSKVTKAFNERQSILPDGRGGKKLFNCKELYRLLITSNGVYQLAQLGFAPHRLVLEAPLPQRSAAKFVTIDSIEIGPSGVDTFCFTEPSKHMGVFNGILTGQCTEILEVTNEKEIASCTLASVALNSCVAYRGKDFKGRPKNPYFDFDKLERLTKQLVRNLDNVIERNYYPDDLPEIRYSNMRHRPLGIGIQGLADAIAALDLTWVKPNTDEKSQDKYVLSEEVRKLNNDIFETMYYSAVEESVALARDKGSYEAFSGSPASKGMFQFDLWDAEKIERQNNYGKNTAYHSRHIDSYEMLCSHIAYNNLPVRESRYSKEQWDVLRLKMRQGLRNSLLLALMPTASSAHILGNNEAFEPYAEAISSRTILSGQFMRIIKPLVKDFKQLDLWTTDLVKHIISNQGSLQKILEPNSGIPDEKRTPKIIARLEHLKLKYRNVFELPQKMMVDLAADRGKFICQTQSSNVFMARPTKTRLNAYHFYAWGSGLKTGMYYLRQKAGGSALNFAMDGIHIPRSSKDEVCTDDICYSCSS